MLLKTALRGNKIRINTYNSGNPFGILSAIGMYMKFSAKLVKNNTEISYLISRFKQQNNYGFLFRRSRTNRHSTMC